MTNVVQLRPADDPNVVLEEAKGLKHVLVLGYDQDGELYAASSPYFGDGGNLLWILECVKAKLLDGDFME